LLLYSGEENVVTNGQRVLHMDHFHNKSNSAPEPEAGTEGRGERQTTLKV
jgi:hypothetical protein